MRHSSKALLFLLLLWPAIGKAWAPRTPFFLVLLVDARHFDYQDGLALFRSIHVQRDGRCDVGHAWILLGGVHDGKEQVWEGGHTGEFGLIEPRYLEGVLWLTEGHTLRMHDGRLFLGDDPNPVRFLHTYLSDGMWQQGSGGHAPSYAIGMDIDEPTFRAIYAYAMGGAYDFSKYSLTSNQCVTFVAKIAALAGCSLAHEVTVTLPNSCSLEGKERTLWQDPLYASITFSTPDVLEASMMEAVQEGRLMPALEWYRGRS